MKMMKMTKKNETKKPTTSGGLWYASFKTSREALKEKVEASLGYDLTLGEYRDWCEDNGYSWRTGMRAVWSKAQRDNLSSSLASWWKVRHGAIVANAKPKAKDNPTVKPVAAKATSIAKANKALGKMSAEEINAVIDKLLAGVEL